MIKEGGAASLHAVIVGSSSSSESLGPALAASLIFDVTVS